MMSLYRPSICAAALGGLFLLNGLSTAVRAEEPLAVRPAVLSAASPTASRALTATPVFHRHYGYYGGGYYRPHYYGGYYGGYRGFYGYRGYYGGYPTYAYGYGMYRPWYTYPQAYWRYGYYAYPSYYTYAYPYSYGGIGLYSSGYLGGIYSPGIAGVTVVAPAPIVATPYAYGAYYSYPAYGSYGCCW